MIALGLLGFAAVVLLIQHFCWKVCPWPALGMKPPKYQGHRGYWQGGALENTLASFKAAKDRGLSMVEMDVRLTKDQVVVVFHDEDLLRLVNVPKKVSDLTCAELQALVAAPTLEQVLTSPDVPQFLNIELKTGKVRDGFLENKVAELVERTKTHSRILFSSFNPLAVRRLSKVLPQVPRALLATKENDPANKIYLRQLWLAPYSRANLLHLDYRYVSDSQLRRYLRRGIPVAFWAVNDSAKAEHLLQVGATSIISDKLTERGVKDANE